MARQMPQQRPGKSKQDYQTPENFLLAAKRRLGITAFGLDIAATADNAVAAKYFTPQMDAFKQPTWRVPRGGWAWLNPPFAQIAPWAARCYREGQAGAQIALLVPASLGANWWSDSVHGKAHIVGLNGRLTFVGEDDPYPKDCALCLYGPGFASGYSIWRWAEALS